MDKKMNEVEKAEQRGWQWHFKDYDPVISVASNYEKSIRNFLEKNTNNISFLKFNNVGNILEIMYFAKCSNMHIKAYIRYRLYEMLEKRLPVLTELLLIEL